MPDQCNIKFQFRFGSLFNLTFLPNKKYYVVLDGEYAFQSVFKKYGVFSSLLYPGVDADAHFTKVPIFRCGLQEMLENFISFVIFHILK